MKNEYTAALQCQKQTLVFDGKAVLHITVETPVIAPENKRTAKLNKYYAAQSESFREWAEKVYYGFVCDDYVTDGDKRKRFRYPASEAKLTYETGVAGERLLILRDVTLTCRGKAVGASRTEEKLDVDRGLIKHLDFKSKM